MQICKGKCSTFLPEIAICLNLQLVRDNQTNRGGRVGGGAHDQPRGQGKTRGQGGLFRHIELVQKQPYLCNSIFLWAHWLYQLEVIRTKSKLVF